MKEPIGTAYMVFYVARTSPYRKIMTEMTFRSLAYGYTSKSWGINKNQSGDVKHEAQMLTINHVSGIFAFWALGILVSVVAFAVEFIWYRQSNLNKVYDFVN